jgi:MoxR-like ATPase
MTYKALFDPAKKPKKQRVVGFSPPAGDDNPSVDYVYSEKITLAVNVALATGRPLLVRGEPGTGKSSLAADVARRLGWRYYRFVVTTRTEASDLLYRFDSVRRFNDANAKELKAAPHYIEPAALWWAFAPDTARRRGTEGGEVPEANDPSPDEGDNAVVLIDEIDKADPDIPNSLLVAFGALEFTVPEVDVSVRAKQAPLLIITTNDERALPEAFLRRCVNLTLPAPDRDRLRSIAQAHFGDTVASDLMEAVLDKREALVTRARQLDIRPPGIAECLDLLWACKHLGITHLDDKRWQEISAATLWKHEELSPPEAPGFDEADEL